MDPAILRAAFERLTKVHGLSPQVATGILGQLTAESGGSLDPGAFNPKDPGGSYGIAQWNRERLAAMRGYSSPYGAENERDRQLDFLVNELRTTHKGVLNRMLAAGDPREMTRAALGFEAPEGYTRDNPEGAHSFGKRYAATASGVPGLLGNASPVTKDGVSVPVAAPVVQRAKDIDEFRRLMSEKFPQLRYTSGYRSPSYNQKVGGAKASQHTHNLAVDVGLKEYDPATQRAIVEYARTIGARGLGYYPGSQSAHFDLRTGAPAAWGANYSRTSLPGTPKWFQEVAQSHLSGAATPPTAVASGGPAGGTMGSAGAGGPAPAPAPAPLTPMQNIAGGISKIATAMQPAPLEVAHPMQDAPVADNPRQDQGGAANLMAQLLEQQRERYTPQQPQQPGIFDTGVFA